MGRGKTKTIHTPEVSEIPMNTITFRGAKIAEFGRVDPASGWVKFHCSLGDGLEPLFKKMGWDVPGNKTTLEKLEGTLSGGHLILTSKDKLVDAEVDIEFHEIKDFSCHRFEIEGRKKKGFRRELRFAVSFKCEDGAANLENYMMRTDNARGSLKVTYLREAVQTEMPMDDSQLSIPAVHATPEQRAAAAEL